MKMNARRDRLFLCIIGLLVAPIALCSSEPLVKIDSILPVPAGKDPNDPNRFSVSGVVYMTGTPVALVTDTARSLSYFVWGNRRVDRYDLREVTREQVVLIERGSGRELRLPVAAATPGGPARFTKEWINSSANPMFRHIVSPPDELYGDWPTASDSDKKEIADFYEKYGWKLVRAEIIAGAADFVWERLYEDERIAAAQVIRDNFLGLLSPAQRQAWEQMQSNPPIYAVDGKMTPEQEQAGAERRRVFAEFRSGFTHEQKAAFEAMRTHPLPPSSAPGKKPEYSLPRLSQDDPANSTAPARYTKAWINSKANPLLHNYDLRINRLVGQDEGQAFPDSSSYSGNIFRYWAALNSAERLQVVEFYQKHGWQLLHIETVSGTTGSMAWRNIHEEQRIAVQKANREAFFALLSPEQRQAWKSKPFGQIIFIKDRNPDYTRNRNGSEHQKFFDPFWASLNEQQKAAYEVMYDFTKADWKD